MISESNCILSLYLGFWCTNHCLPSISPEPTEEQIQEWAPHHKLDAWRSCVLVRLSHGQEHLWASASKERRQGRLGHASTALSQPETSLFFLVVGIGRESQGSLPNIWEERAFLIHTKRNGCRKGRKCSIYITFFLFFFFYCSIHWDDIG